MRWQNLIYKKCPRCDARLDAIIRKKRLYFECLIEKSGCGFIISAEKLGQILTDENHIMRKFLTPHERTSLETAINEVMAENKAE